MMKLFVYQPVRWDRKAATSWQTGRQEEALFLTLATLDRMETPDADAFLQPAFYAFQMNRFAESAVLLEKAVGFFPDHPMVRLGLGNSYSRGRQHRKAVPHLDAFIAMGLHDMSAYDALAHSLSEIGDLLRAKVAGTMALTLKDLASKGRHGTPSLKRDVQPVGKKNVIAFSLFGSGTKYLRGALHNVLAARTIYPDWTCRFYADDSVDHALRSVLAEEGAEVVMDEGGNNDDRWRLSRRFLVNDDPDVGYFLCRDADSVVNDREKAAVAQWLGSGLPFHVMRDWYSHTDPMLGGLWGGIAGVFPDLDLTLDRFLTAKPITTAWDQFFLRDQVWPAIRDDVMVHDRCFESHAAHPFPTQTPLGREHVGQNEFANDEAAQASLLGAYGDRIPALGLRERSLNLKVEATP